MKISPVSAQGTTIGAIGSSAEPQPGVQQRTRSLRMTTNATPGREEIPPVNQELPISDKDVGTTPPEATEPLSPQFAALARQKRALQVKERELSDREKALTTQSTTQVDMVSKADLKANALGVLLDAGVTYDDLTQQILANNDGVTPELRALKAEIKALKEGVDKTLTDRDVQAEQQVLAEMRREATQLVAQGETYELVRETRSIPHVIKLIERTYRETGEVLDVREALKLVEDDLLAENLKLANLQKIRAQMAPQPVSQPTQQHRQMRTLTNRDTASVPMSAKQRALAAFNGTLRK